MATAQFSGQYGHNMTLEVWSDWNRQDMVNNRSTVNLQARLRTNGYASVWGVTAPMTIYVDGNGEIVNAGVNIGTNSSLLIFGKDYVVTMTETETKRLISVLKLILIVAVMVQPLLTFLYHFQPFNEQVTSALLLERLEVL